MAPQVSKPLANEFFAGYGDTSATMLFTRYSAAGGRPHLLGANISNLTLNQLQSINGSLSIAFENTHTLGRSIFPGSRISRTAAKAIESSAQYQFAGRGRYGRKFDRAGLSFVHRIAQWGTSPSHVVSSGSIELGAQISGPGIPAGSQIVTQ